MDIAEEDITRLKEGLGELTDPRRPWGNIRHNTGGQPLSGSFCAKALTKAIAVAECNASMGKIVAAPTAGSCGILPAAILTMMEERGVGEDQAVMALFTAGALGMVIANEAGISGAQGGCQAECGSAAAIAYVRYRRRRYGPGGHQERYPRGRGDRRHAGNRGGPAAKSAGDRPRGACGYTHRDRAKVADLWVKSDDFHRIAFVDKF